MKIVTIVNGVSLNYYRDYAWDRSSYNILGFCISYRTI